MKAHEVLRAAATEVLAVGVHAEIVWYRNPKEMVIVSDELAAMMRYVAKLGPAYQDRRPEFQFLLSIAEKITGEKAES